MQLEDKPISEAVQILGECIALIDDEPQQTFLLRRLRTDMETARNALRAVQTVVVPPVNDIRWIDGGEPTAYEVTK